MTSEAKSAETGRAQRTTDSLRTGADCGECRRLRSDACAREAPSWGGAVLAASRLIAPGILPDLPVGTRGSARLLLAGASAGGEESAQEAARGTSDHWLPARERTSFARTFCLNASINSFLTFKTGSDVK